MTFVSLGKFLYVIHLVIDLERDLELERRRAREFQDAAREREKEYQKLKVRSFEDLNTDPDFFSGTV